MRLFVQVIIFLQFFSTLVVQAQIPSELLNQDCNSMIFYETFNQKNCAENSTLMDLNDFYLIDSNDENKNINVNFVIIQKNDSSGNFQQNNTEHEAFFQDVISNLNWRVSELDTLNCGGIYADSKIRFDVEFIYIQDDYYWNNENDYNNCGCPSRNNWYLKPLAEQIDSLSIANERPAINVFFTENECVYNDIVLNLDSCDTSFASCACSMGISYNIFDGSWVHFRDKYSKYHYAKNYGPSEYQQPWDPIIRSWIVNSLGGGLAHELGHCFQDIVGHVSTCNNIMNPSGGSDRRFLTEDQIGLWHRMLSIGNIRRFVDSYPYSDSPRLINNNSVFDFDLKLYRDIRVLDSSNLIIDCNLMLPDQANIYIENGSKLTIESNSIITKNEYNEIWEGDIIVEEGGIIEVMDGSTLTLSGNGKLEIQKNNNTSAEFIINQNAFINLLNENTNIDIAGDLYIEDNATFTFSGDGYIKFSNPGDDNTWNISCGTGASVYLEGSGRNDKIVEVQQSTVRFPQDLSSLTFKNGSIEMGDDKRMLATDDYDITFDNVKITSDDGSFNAHRSFHVYGQQNVTIVDCVFEYGKWGLFGNLTYNAGAPLTILNSEFRYNEAGLYIYNKGIHLDNCNFSNNTGNAIHCENMSMNSDFTDCSVLTNNYGVVYQGSSNADLSIDNSDISYNTQTGVKVNGAFDLDLACNTINNNRYGVYTQNGTYLRMENYARNDVSDNQKSLYLNCGRLFLQDGYNQLQSINDDYAVYGYAVERCGAPAKDSAKHNRWENDVSETPLMNGNYALWVYNCLPLTPVNLIDNNPDYQVCPQFNPLTAEQIDSEQNSTEINTETSDNTLEAQLSSMALQSTGLTSASEIATMINQYISFISTNADNPSSMIGKAWADMHDLLDKYLEIVDYTTNNPGFNQSVDQVMQLNEQLMLDADAIAYYEYALDNALLERLRGNFDEALLLLDLLIPELEGMERETSYVNRWACHIEAEQEAAMGNLSPDEFMAAIETCNASYENSMENLPDASENETGTETPAPEIHIVPNPNNGNFTVEVSECTAGSSLRISNLYAQPVYTQTFTESGPQTVQVAGLAQGQYTVYYLENDVVISSVNVIVE